MKVQACQKVDHLVWSIPPFSSKKHFSIVLQYCIWEALYKTNAKALGGTPNSWTFCPPCFGSGFCYISSGTPKKPHFINRKRSKTPPPLKKKTTSGICCSDRCKGIFLHTLVTVLSIFRGWRILEIIKQVTLSSNSLYAVSHRAFFAHPFIFSSGIHVARKGTWSTTLEVPFVSASSALREVCTSFAHFWCAQFSKTRQPPPHHKSWPLPK